MLFTSLTQLTPLSESQASLKPLPRGLGASVTQLRRMLVAIALKDDKSVDHGKISNMVGNNSGVVRELHFFVQKS